MESALEKIKDLEDRLCESNKTRSAQDSIILLQTEIIDTKNETITTLNAEIEELRENSDALRSKLAELHS